MKLRVHVQYLSQHAPLIQNPVHVSFMHSSFQNQERIAGMLHWFALSIDHVVPTRFSVQKKVSSDWMIRQQEPRDPSHELFPTLIESYIGILNCALSFTLHQVWRWRCVFVHIIVFGSVSVCVCVCANVHSGEITSARGCAAPVTIFIILSHYLWPHSEWFPDMWVCVLVFVYL